MRDGYKQLGIWWPRGLVDAFDTFITLNNLSGRKEDMKVEMVEIGFRFHPVYRGVSDKAQSLDELVILPDEVLPEEHDRTEMVYRTQWVPESLKYYIIQYLNLNKHVYYQNALAAYTEFIIAGYMYYPVHKRLSMSPQTIESPMDIRG